MNKSFFLLTFLLILITDLSSQSAATQSNPSFLLKPSLNVESDGFDASRLLRIDENMKTWMQDGRLNGGVALIAHKGKIVYHKAFGYDDLQKTKALRTDHIYRIASQTKAITSVAVMMLYEEGKFMLDDPISKYIPEFAKPSLLDKYNSADTSFTTTPAKSEITIRQLLTHTSGIGYPQIGSEAANAIYAKAGLIAGLGSDIGRILGDDVKKIAKLPLFNNPGAAYLYGWNSDVLGYLVEVTSGMSLDQFFKKRIFEPLGMNDTYFYLPPSKHNRLVTLFQEKDKKLVDAVESAPTVANYPTTSGTFYSGGAGLSSTAIDYAIFLQMLLNDGIYNGKRILAPNTVRMMTMNQIGDLTMWNGVNKFGLGFGITTEKGSALLPTPEGVFEWGGAFSTTYWADPQEELVCLFYRQLYGTTIGNIADKFKVLVYQALK